MSIYQWIAEQVANGGGGAVCTIISSSGSTPRHTGSKMLVYPDARFRGSVGGGEMEGRVIQEALEVIAEGKPRQVSYSMVNPKDGDPGVCGGTVDIFIEPLPNTAVLLIIGGGHVGKAVAHLGKWLGFRVIVSDDRQEYCTHDANPDADGFLPIAMGEIPDSFPITTETYIVITTRGVAVDIPGLPPLLNTPARYIGLIGSRRRWMTTRKALEESGISEPMIAKIQSPIGLELNAETPEEIAVSILAEILMLRNGGSGSRMKI